MKTVEIQYAVLVMIQTAMLAAMETPVLTAPWWGSGLIHRRILVSRNALAMVEPNTGILGRISVLTVRLLVQHVMQVRRRIVPSVRQERRI